MAEFSRISLYLSNDEKRILDATASRLNISRSEVMRHLVLYHGLCGGDFPLTSKILALPAVDRERIIEQLRIRAESGDPIKPQQFREWVKETLGTSDDDTVAGGADALIRKLLVPSASASSSLA